MGLHSLGTIEPHDFMDNGIPHRHFILCKALKSLHCNLDAHIRTLIFKALFRS